MPQNGGGKGWLTDPESGQKVMPEVWASFLDWLLQGRERDPKWQYEWAEANGVHVDSVRRWKRDPRFIREWDRRCAELNIHPERTQGVIDSLHQAAVGGSVQAASLYLQYVEKFTPKRRVMVDDERDTAALTDWELADELESLVAEFRDVEVSGGVAEGDGESDAGSAV